MRRNNAKRRERGGIDFNSEVALSTDFFWYVMILFQAARKKEINNVYRPLVKRGVAVNQRPGSRVKTDA